MSVSSWVRGLLTGSVLLLAPFFCLADDGRPVIDLILPVDNAPLREFANHVQTHNSDYEVRQYIRTPPPPEQRGDILVTVSDSLLAVLASEDYPREIALYVSETAFLDYQAPGVTAVFSNQPLRRQLALTSAILDQRPARLAVPYLNPYFRDKFTTAITNYPHLSANVEAVSADHPTEVINRLIQQTDVLLATPEIEIYNADTIRSILLSSYRHRTIVIGPNEGFVTAGALASVVSQPVHYAVQLNTALKISKETGSLPPADYPWDFDVVINDSVARSLGLSHLSADLLKQRIQQRLAGSEQ